MGDFSREAFGAYAEAHVPDWKDGERMSFLMDPFEIRTVDPERWADRMRFWTRTIDDFARRARCPCVSLRTLRDAMRWTNGQHARGLHVVLAELEKDRKVRPAEDLVRAAAAEVADGGVGWATWLLSKAVIGPARWTLGQLVGGRSAPPSDVSDVPEELLERKFVLVDALQELAEAAERAAAEADEAGAGAVLLLGELAQRAGLSDEAAELAAGLLCERRRAAVLPTGADGRGERAIKFAARGAKSVKVSEADRGIAHMRATKRLLDRQVASLEAQVEGLTERARAAVLAGRQDEAKRLLRERLPFKRLLEQRHESKRTLDGVLARIADAHVSAQVLEAYREGARTLKAVTAAAGLTPERVEETMEALEDALADQRDLDAALARGVAGPEGAGEEDLLSELADIERRMRDEAAAAEAAAAAAAAVGSPARAAAGRGEAEAHAEASPAPPTPASPPQQQRQEREQEQPAAPRQALPA
eukprot:tig00021168_g19073.t1